MDLPYPSEVIRLKAKRQVIGGKKADRSLDLLTRWVGKKPILAAAYSPDGSLFAAAERGRLFILERHTGKITNFRLPVSLLWAVSVSPDNKTVAWIGEKKPRAYEYEEFINPDIFGLVELDTGKVSTWSASRIGLTRKGFFLGGDQMDCRIALAKNREALYFLFWKGSTGNLARFDIKQGTIGIIAKDVQSFAVPYKGQ
jgi:hypothetical protein